MRIVQSDKGPKKGNPSQLELVVLALYALGGSGDVIDTEDVAVKANELAPGRFTWRKHPEQINLELVRVFLSDAAKKANGSLVAGSGRKGWSLTRAGADWANLNAERLLHSNLSRSRHELKSGSIDEARWQRERRRLQGTEAWGIWVRGEHGEIPARQAAEVFRIDSYSTGRQIHLKIARLIEMFEGDGEIAPFLRAASEIVLRGKAINDGSNAH